NAKLRHDCFACAGRSCHHDGVTTEEDGDRLALEGVEGEGVERFELGDGVAEALHRAPLSRLAEGRWLRYNGRNSGTGRCQNCAPLRVARIRLGVAARDLHNATNLR